MRVLYIICSFYRFDNSIEGRAYDQLPITHTLIRGVRVDLSKETICRFLFGLEFMGSATTIEFYHRLRIKRSRRTIRGINLRD